MKPAVFASKEPLVRAVNVSMPDEYPSGMATVLAEWMMEEGKAIISPENQTTN